MASVLSLAAACTGLTGGDSEAVAIEFVAPPDTIHVDSVKVVNVRVLNRSGDSIPGATWVLLTLSPDTIGIDSARHAVIGLRWADTTSHIGSGRILARTGDLPSAPFRIVVIQP